MRFLSWWVNIHGTAIRESPRRFAESGVVEDGTRDLRGDVYATSRRKSWQRDCGGSGVAPELTHLFFQMTGFEPQSRLRYSGMAATSAIWGVSEKSEIVALQHGYQGDTVAQVRQARFALTDR